MLAKNCPIGIGYGGNSLLFFRLRMGSAFCLFEDTLDLVSDDLSIF